MVTSVTEGVKVSVETDYFPEYSNPRQFHYVFTYRITIENNSDYTIRLERRQWKIHDASYAIREIEGEGVIGQQPELEPGEQHRYISGCNIKSGIGKMHGSYFMKRLVDGKEFRVIIPEFKLTVPYLLN